MLVEPLGRGAFGEVWKASGPGGFFVALKIVPTEAHIHHLEARSLEIMKEVRHPHLLSVFGAWKIEGRLIIAMELADRTLRSRLDEAKKEGYEGIPRAELLRYAAEAASAIDHLNCPRQDGRLPIVHGDIKPENLLLCGGSVKVGDFGVAQSIRYNAADHVGGLTGALLDRLTHRVHIVEIKGDSYRLKSSLKTTKQRTESQGRTTTKKQA